jgi:carbamoyltransferase
MLVSLGISAGFHDSSACVVGSNGAIVYAASEERYSRIKGDRGFPFNAIENALRICTEAGYRIEKICVHEDFIRRPPSSLLKGYLSHHGRKRGERVLVMLSTLDILAKRCGLGREDIVIGRHHESHAYSAIGTAPFDDGVVVVLDALGEDSSGLIAKYENRLIVNQERFSIRKSLGLIYSLITVHSGFRVMTGEYKLMGLAPYGDPAYVDLLESIFGDSKETLNIGDVDIFAESLSSAKLEAALGFGPRDPNSTQIRKCYADLAASVQVFLERRVSEVIDSFLDKHQVKTCSLALSGGVALNCKLNLYLAERYAEKVKEIWAFPASGDAGSAVGACLQYYLENGLKKEGKKFDTFLGCHYEDYVGVLDKSLMAFKPLTEKEMLRLVKILVSGGVGAIHEGQAEFGPRALGHRSIIASAQRSEAIQKINRNVKSREDFRPLAPVILARNAGSLLQINANSVGLYGSMLSLARSKNAKAEAVDRFKSSIEDTIRPFSDTDFVIPSAVHLDGTARVQIIGDESQLTIRKILELLDEQHGVKALINTSLNVRGEPICETVSDSLNCFKAAGLDFLIVEDFVLYRCDQDPLIIADHKSRLGLD